VISKEKNQPVDLERGCDVKEALPFLNRSEARASSKRVAAAEDQVGDGADTVASGDDKLRARPG
jgi:hypothetical protein